MVRQAIYDTSNGVVYIRSFSRRNEDPSDVTVTDNTGLPTIRVRLPKQWKGEQFGRAEQMMGANHIRVLCVDGITRMGRIKGKIKKRAWIREGDFLIVAPWSFQDEKCDISYRYLPPQVAWLRRNRYIT
jgi:translation initiation factor 1A